VSITILPLCPRGKSPPYTLDRRLGGPQRRSGRYRESKILNPIGIRTPPPPRSMIQPGASRYTACATATLILMYSYKLSMKLRCDKLNDERYADASFIRWMPLRLFVLQRLIQQVSCAIPTSDYHRRQSKQVVMMNSCISIHLPLAIWVVSKRRRLSNLS
jgi:hypothetical protein